MQELIEIKRHIQDLPIKRGRKRDMVNQIMEFGYKEIGSGASKIALKHRQKDIVVKVGDYQKEDVISYRSLTRSKTGRDSFIPTIFFKFYNYHVQIQPYGIVGAEAVKRDEFKKDLKKLEKRYYGYDIFAGNVAYYKDKLVIIDW